MVKPIERDAPKSPTHIQISHKNHTGKKYALKRALTDQVEGEKHIGGGVGGGHVVRASGASTAKGRKGVYRRGA